MGGWYNSCNVSVTYRGMERIVELFETLNLEEKITCVKALVPKLNAYQLHQLKKEVQLHETRRIDFLQQLPLEIATSILSYLNFNSLKNALLVSKTWHQMTKFPVVWKERLRHMYYPLDGLEHEDEEYYYKLCKHVVLRDLRWKFMAPEYKMHYKPHADKITAIKVKQGHIATGAMDRKLKLFPVPSLPMHEPSPSEFWDLPVPCIVEKEFATPSCVDFDMTSGILCSGDFNGNVNIIRFRKNIEKTVLCHTSAVTSLCIYEKLVLSGGADGIILVLDADGTILKSIQAHFERVSSLCISDSLMVSGSFDSTVRVWDTNDDYSCVSSSQHSDQITSLRCSKHQITFTAGSTVYIADYLDGMDEGAPVLHNRYLNYHAVKMMDRNNKFIVTLSTDRIYNNMMKMHVLDSKNLRVLSDMVCPNPGTLVFAVDDDRIVTGNEDGSISIVSFV